MTAPAEGNQALFSEQAAQGKYHEPLEVMSASAFERKFGSLTTTKRIGGGGYAEVHSSTQPGYVLKFISFQNGAHFALSEAIAYARVNSSPLEKRLPRVGDNATPIARVEYGMFGGFVIAVPSIHGSDWGTVIREVKRRDSSKELLNLRVEAARELITKTAIAHHRGVAIRDIKLDGLLVAALEEENFSARWIDMNQAIIIPDISVLSEQDEQALRLLTSLDALRKAKVEDILQRQRLVAKLDNLMAQLDAAISATGRRQPLKLLSFMAERVSDTVSRINVQKSILGSDKTLAQRPMQQGSHEKAQSYPPKCPTMTDTILMFFSGKSARSVL